jgi:hypothetical protein
MQPALRGGALVTMAQRRLVLNGPLYLINGDLYGAIARLPIFIPNSTLEETFGSDRNCEWECSCGM